MLLGTDSQNGAGRALTYIALQVRELEVPYAYVLGSHDLERPSVAIPSPLHFLTMTRSISTLDMTRSSPDSVPGMVKLYLLRTLKYIHHSNDTVTGCTNYELNIYGHGTTLYGYPEARIWFLDSSERNCLSKRGMFHLLIRCLNSMHP